MNRESIEDTLVQLISSNIKSLFSITAKPSDISTIKTLSEMLSYIEKQLFSSGWQEYVDTTLMDTNYYSGAAIAGMDGDLWACSEQFDISSAELKYLSELFETSNNTNAKEFKIFGISYEIKKNENNLIYGIKGNSACVCVRTSLAVIIGIVCEGVSKLEAVNEIERLAEYMRDSGY